MSYISNNGRFSSIFFRKRNQCWLFSSQDDYVEALSRLHLTVSRAYRVNPEINFEVFIHKVDGLSDDHKIETQRDIHQRANDDLADASLEKLHLRYSLSFFLFSSVLSLSSCVAVPDACFSDISLSSYTVRLFHFRAIWKIPVRMYERSERNTEELNQFEGVSLL